MILTRLLEIDRKLLTPEEEFGLDFAERLWCYVETPKEARDLERALDHIIDGCRREGVQYPRILLRRKKDLQRGTWVPRVAGWDPRPHYVPYFTPAEGACQLCGGTGNITNPGGMSSRFCECYLKKIQEAYEAKLKKTNGPQTKP